MGIIKLIILLLGITLLFLGARLFFRIWGLIKTARPFAKNFKNNAQNTANTQNTDGQLVQCAFCGIYLPTKQAYSKNNLYFCNTDHAKQYEQQS